MFILDFKSRKPLHEQLVTNVIELIVNGILKQDEKLPSVRELASMLTVNPNTIQKAYRELERQGYIYSVRGKGSFVSEMPDSIDHAKINRIIEAFEKKVHEAKYFKIDENALIKIIHEIYVAEEGK